MEAPEYFAGGYYRGGNSQFIPERNGKDHFIVEDLLDFTNEEGDAGAEEEAGFESAAGNSTESSTVTAVDSCNSSFSGGEQQLSGDNPTDAGDLCEPYDELAELEWLSNFVEESFSSEDLQKLQLISGVQSSTSSTEATRVPVQSSENNITDQPTAAEALFLPEASSVPGKARSKRSRAAPCNWSSRLLVLSPSAAAATAAATLPSSDTDAAVLLNLPKKSPKTSKKCELPGIAGPALAPSDGRRCLHCATDKTPQWRTGPMGPKTLCNACGVRYKSGRLVPEYRPASSPTFVLTKHSNSHRKVLELRRQKEIQHSSPQQQQHPLLQIGSSVSASGDDFLIHHHLGPDFRQLI
ncbi:uncharacterized protein M6B38_198820 [Iris pallida]|uniref:GATA transcription factor n=1 Tax=Iris pallida TaxID=29817 RepID=A0AAX6EB00_IRIPA|nr:uncharacterized protein M6B38_198820 [Iris pallida]